QKRDSQSQKRDSQSQKRDSQSQKRDFETSKPLPAKRFETSQTIQTYSDLLNTLSEGVRERFENFCKKKIEECQFRIASRKSWLNKHGAEYWEEYQEKYPNALSNEAVTPPKTDVSDLVDIPYLQRLYGDGWQEAAKHHGLILPNSPTVEIQKESEQVVPSKLPTRSYAPCPDHLRGQIGKLFTTRT
ncbi:hypothetical protein, partial [Microcoleus sp. B3-D7]|uniref:hypothetical protein n=1 Tax=Microcoleus sp. B3-D7 TaxID=2818659 RepID=UPI002FD35421